MTDLINHGETEVQNIFLRVSAPLWQKNPESHIASAFTQAVKTI